MAAEEDVDDLAGDDGGEAGGGGLQVERCVRRELVAVAPAAGIEDKEERGKRDGSL